MRDLAVGALFTSLIQFGAMPAAIFADVAAWAVVVLVAHGVPRIVAGPARADVPRP